MINERFASAAVEKSGTRCAFSKISNIGDDVPDKVPNQASEGINATT